MSKAVWKPGTLLAPVPAVMVSCGTMEKSNIITIAWTGIVNSDPAMTYISVRPSRYSYDLIKESGEFVINLTTEALAEATDWCGVRSGREYNKFEVCGLTPSPAAVVNAPIIEEAPIAIECRVREVIKLGSHDMFLAEVVNVQADDAYINPETGRFELERARPITYMHGHYYSLGKQIGRFGWTVQRKRKKK